MLKVIAPAFRMNERRYIAKVLLTEFLGLEFVFEVTETSHWSIQLASDPTKELKVSDSFFAQADEHWLEPASLPAQPLTLWDASVLNLDLANIPVIYGEAKKSDCVSESEQGIHLSLDIFGSAFFMLTRYEEVVKPDRDAHGRFPAVASVAYQENFLSRPIVNEYLEILWQCMQRLWPGLKRKARSYRFILSHDVDVPLLSLPADPRRLIRNLGADVLKRRSVELAARRGLSYLGRRRLDPANTFDRLMDLSERAGVKSAFYFIAARSAGEIDGHYSLDMPFIRQLLRRIHERGHEIGLHPSYNTCEDAQQTGLEFQKLLAVLDEEGIEQEDFGGRQHYLRWQAPTTWQNWEAAGLSYDSTLGYAEQVGFRTGSCYSYSVFDVVTGEALELVEYPLLTMDVTLYAKHYMSLSFDEALTTVSLLKSHCQRYGGDYTFLWHNSYLVEPWQQQAYTDLLAELSK